MSVRQLRFAKKEASLCDLFVQLSFCREHATRAVILKSKGISCQLASEHLE